MAEVALPPGGARRLVRPILASRIIGKSLRLWLSSLPQLLVVASIAWLPLFALRWVLRGQSGWMSTVATSLPMLQLVAVTAIGQAFAVRFIFQRLRGEPTDLARSIAVGARRFGVVIAIALLLALPQFAFVAANSVYVEELRSAGNSRAVATFAPEMLLATTAFLICELIVILVYPVAAPAAVVEGGGVFASLRRSAALTKGRRSTIFGIVIGFGLIAFVPAMALAVAILSMRAGVAKFLVTSAMELFMASLHCVTPVVLYHELRDSKEGFGLDDLASVFD